MSEKTAIILYTTDWMLRQQARQSSLTIHILDDSQQLLEQLSNLAPSVSEVTLVIDLMDPGALTLLEYLHRHHYHTQCVVIGLLHPAAVERKMTAKLLGVRYCIPRQMFPMMLQWGEQYL